MAVTHTTQQTKQRFSPVSLPPVSPIPYVPVASTRKLLGAFYTPASAADYMSDWSVRHPFEHVLEPSFGNGSFLKAVVSSAERQGLDAIRLSGVEFDEGAWASALQSGLLDSDSAHLENFLAVPPFKVNAVIGNPPYVRLRHLAKDQRDLALSVSGAVLGQPMDPAGSLWMAFLLHAMRFLHFGGRLAFVLPYDFTYVRYARPLWEKLRRSFGSLRVIRTHERLFPDLLQDVVILLADDFGSRTDHVRFQAFERVADLCHDRPIIDEFLCVDEVRDGRRVFVEALLARELRALLQTCIAEATVPAKRLVRFNIGYVAGDKTFFHPDMDDVCGFNLTPESLHPTLTSARMLRGAGLATSSLALSKVDLLFSPVQDELADGDRQYIAMGEKMGVANRYKCRIREPWYRVPGTRVPDVVLSVFSERPLLLINDARYFASNSLLCGYSLGPSPEQLAASWYTSLTRLQCELEIHSLGGGVMVLVPQETGNVRLPRQVPVSAEHLSCIDAHLKRGEVAEAYRAGDHEILRNHLGLHASDVDLVTEGLRVLAHWRTAARARVSEAGRLEAAGGVS